MSQAKIDQYKKEKANRKSNAKKARTKKKLGFFGGIAAGVIVVGLLVWGIVATVQDGGLSKIANQKSQAQNEQLVTQELIEYLNSASGTNNFSDETAE